jgi:hypothetical protein
MLKEQYHLELDTPVYVNSHKQYGVIRKIIKGQGGSSLQSASGEAAIVGGSKITIKEEVQSYEVRLSTTLENVIADPLDLKRIITVAVRIHSYKNGQEA